MKKNLIILVLLSLLTVIILFPASNVPVLGSEVLATYSPQIFPDGQGGAVIVLRDYKYNTLILQRLDGVGKFAWETPTILYDISNGFTLASDGNGNLFVAWSMMKEGHISYAVNNDIREIRVQKVDSSGNTMWPIPGITVLRQELKKDIPLIAELALAPDQSGGVTVTWIISGSNQEVFSQKINASGSLLWESIGISLPQNIRNPHGLSCISDGADGVIITWVAGVYTDQLIVQRLDKEGNRLWGNNGLQPGDITGPSYTLIPDSNGGVIVVSNRLQDIIVTHLDASGRITWTNIFARQETGFTRIQGMQIIPDDNGGIFISWMEMSINDANRLLACHLNDSGILTWGEMPAVLSGSFLLQNSHQIACDGSGGIIIAWEEIKDKEPSIFFQHISSEGNILWGKIAVVIDKLTGTLKNMVGYANNSGMIIVTEKSNDSQAALYVSAVDLSGNTIIAESYLFPEKLPEISRTIPDITPDLAPIHTPIEIKYHLWHTTKQPATHPLLGIAIFFGILIGFAIIILIGMFFSDFLLDLIRSVFFEKRIKIKIPRKKPPKQEGDIFL